MLVEDELARRADRLFARRLKQAGITTVKTLADFDWTFNPKIPKAKIVELASARFVETHGGVLLIGPPGVGKSHIATAIAVGAIRAGRRALVRSTFDLAADFAEADATGARRDLVQQLTRVDLLVLEDFGMKKLGIQRRRREFDLGHDNYACGGIPGQGGRIKSGPNRTARRTPFKDGKLNAPRSVPSGYFKLILHQDRCGWAEAR